MTGSSLCVSLPNGRGRYTFATMLSHPTSLIGASSLYSLVRIANHSFSVDGIPIMKDDDREVQSRLDYLIISLEQCETTMTPVVDSSIPVYLLCFIRNRLEIFMVNR